MHQEALLGSFEDLVGEIDEEELLTSPKALINQTVDVIPTGAGASSLLVIKAGG